MKPVIDLTKEYGIVLEGGGAKGAYQIGAWKALVEAGVKINAVAGTSVGALNGALICMRDVDKAEKIWRDIKYSNVMDVNDVWMADAMAKERSHFRIHKCVNQHCSYYLSNLKCLPKDLPAEEKYKYKLHYIYRELTMDFFKMDLHALPKRATNFKYKKFNAHIMGLCLTYHVNLQLSTRQTARALKEVHGIDISHTTVSNYALTAASVIKPFVDTFDYQPSNNLAADETYIKVKGIRYYIWFVMDATKKSILGYQVSDTRAVGPCILSMRMAFEKFKTFPGKALTFVADGYSAYPLAKQQFEVNEGKVFDAVGNVLK